LILDNHAMKALPLLPRLLMLLGFVAATPAFAAGAPKTVAVFGFTLDNTSPLPSTPEELARTARIGSAFAADLQKSGLYRVVDTPKAAALMDGQTNIRNCNGCELDAAKKLGAQLAAYGWVQKVSDLILNLNCVIEDANTGKFVAGGSVDIRGNTDESWNHGLQFLMQEHVLPR
jgi:hypothetical protein